MSELSLDILYIIAEKLLFSTRNKLDNMWDIEKDQTLNINSALTNFMVFFIFCKNKKHLVCKSEMLQFFITSF